MDAHSPASTPHHPRSIWDAEPRFGLSFVSRKLEFLKSQMYLQTSNPKQPLGRVRQPDPPHHMGKLRQGRGCRTRCPCARCPRGRRWGGCCRTGGTGNRTLSPTAAAPRPRAARLTSARTRQRRCRELPGEEMLRTGEDESRPPKREQGSSETVPSAGAALPLPFPRQMKPEAAGLPWVGRKWGAEVGRPIPSLATGCPRLGCGCHPRSTLAGLANAAGSIHTWIQTCGRAPISTCTSL